jgi:hypothetical protein
VNALLQFCFGCYTDALTLTFSQETESGDYRLLCGWEVSRRHGVPMVSHDGSGFDSDANVVLGYKCAWHRMTKLAIVRRDDPAGCRRQGDRKRVPQRASSWFWSGLSSMS